MTLDESLAAEAGHTIELKTYQLEFGAAWTHRF